MKSIVSNRIPSLEEMPADVLEGLMKGLERHSVSCVNWPEYGYAPSVSFSIAHSSKAFAVMFDVSEEHVRGTETVGNSPVWEDSCVEIFIADPSDRGYYNFEINCIGTILAAKRWSRQDADLFPEDRLGRIMRHGSLPDVPVDSCGEAKDWRMLVVIPFELLGMERAPESMRANFYKCGDRCSRPHYLSWSPIELPEPDFHCPDFFGEIILP